MAVSKKFLIYIYYVIMLLILVSWTNTTSTPPELYRIIYLIALMMPAILIAPTMLPIILTLFYTVSNYGCYNSYMPNQTYLYLPFLFLALILNKDRTSSKDIIFIVVFLVYTVIINLISSATFEPISSCLIMLLCFYKLVPWLNSSYVHLFSYALLLISLILSLQFIINGSNFQDTFGYGEFDSRTEWMDPNYFGCVVGIGAIASLIEGLSNSKSSILKNLICFIVYGISCYVLLKNGSRGALLSTFCSSVVLFIMSNIKFSKKILAIILFILFLFVLYNIGVFDFLLYRIVMDEGGGGSGRTTIWSIKMDSFGGLPFYNQLFGIGYEEGMMLGFNYKRGFHNDFVAFIVEYGYLGIFFLLYFLLMPIRCCYNKWVVVSLVIYVVTVSLTLEPISGGMFPYFSLILYAILIAKSKTFTLTNYS